ncbi:cell division protein FtsL [Cohnella panacarvi]|uniref:cell division protein FtsL n=1 Tax=Cohnella panacarvi TaxID=400776 RepID=UPI00047EFB0D|nr:cell division protein FtsL [Cohnella panacarvi]
MQYYGNLALRPERVQEQPQSPARQQSQQVNKVVRRRSITMGEKLLYLVTVAVVVLVAGLIIYRYAEIYQINGQIQDTTRQYTQTTEHMKELQREVEHLSDMKRIRDLAAGYGMVQVENRSITITSSGGDQAVVAKP